MTQGGRLRSLYDAYLRRRPKQSRSRIVVEAILGAAAEVLARADDEERVTLERIAHRAGVGIGSVYDYFGDRRNVLEGLAAKLLEDNLRELEARLAETQSLPLEVAVRFMIDDLFARYVAHPRLSQAVQRISTSMGLLPALADNMERFADTLASALRRRNDVVVGDYELAAYSVANMTMGVIHTAVWERERRYDDETLKRELVEMVLRRLRANDAR